MGQVGELRQQLGGLRITAEAAFELRVRATPAHFYGYTNDVPPVGSQWAWARHWIRAGDNPQELTNDPEIKRIICFLTGCDACRFTEPVPDNRPDTQELPDIHGLWDLPGSASESGGDSPPRRMLV